MTAQTGAAPKAPNPTVPWSIFGPGGPSHPDAGGNFRAITWVDTLLSILKAPLTPSNRRAVYDQVVSEGGGGLNNPLNVGPDPAHPGWSTGSQFGGGAAGYDTYAHGLQATADYLNMPNYHVPLLDLLGGHGEAYRLDIVKSPWASGHYGGALSNAPIPTASDPNRNVTSPVDISNEDVVRGLPGGGVAADVYDSTVGAVKTTADVVKGIWSDVNSVSWWIRVGLVLLGFALLVIGVRAAVGSSVAEASEPEQAVVREGSPPGTHETVEGASL